MIISTNREESEESFEDLLLHTKYKLEKTAQESPEFFLSRESQKFEVDVAEAMRHAALYTPFEETIHHYSGIKFPDIVAKKYFGVEVKTTVQSHWRTTGNSIFESTRVEDVKKIYLLFGKLSDPIEFKYRKYEDCLCDIVVTHSPRYLIDMNLQEGETIFDKVGVDYDSFRNLSNPFKPITQYYRDKLSPGEDLWWLEAKSDTVENPSTPLAIRLWRNLDIGLKRQIIVRSFVFFPEIFGSDYKRISPWLVQEYGVISPSLRDTFSAGGRCVLPGPLQKWGELPHMYSVFFENISTFKQLLRREDINKLLYYWGIEELRNERLVTWAELVRNYLEPKNVAPFLDILNIN